MLSKKLACPKSIQSSQVSSYQEYDSKDWRTSISITVSELQPQQAGRLLSVGNAAGADSVSGPNLSVKDSKAAYNAANKKALQDAQSKASSAAAAASNGKITSIISIEEANAPSAGPYPLEASADSKSVPIEVGEQTITANVTVTYAFKEN